MAARVSFLAFYLMWAKYKGWTVPDVHVRACHWFEHRGNFAVLRAHRGFSKSTLLAVYNAWRFYCDPAYRILHQSESDPTAYKTSRDTQNVLERHPLTRGLFRDGGVQEWWVHGAIDARNASMYSRGILSNVTSARADECQNDDVEVPRNIQTPEAREKLRYRLGEQVHILVPGGRQIFIGTPHTHDSLYDEMEKAGADCLTIPMFGKSMRVENTKERRHAIGFAPEFAFAGIGKATRLLRAGVDYEYAGGAVTLKHEPEGVVDFYAGVAWPDRFDGDELLRRRKRTRTLNEWDSQYQLKSKPIHDVRLDPARIRPYSAEPVLEFANKEARMMLGRVRIVSARAYWDCATGKPGADDSALSLILDDDFGNSYWHICEAMKGEFAEFSDARNTEIIGGQVLQAAKIIKRLHVPQVYVEDNGAGSFVPQLLMRALKQERIQCGVKAIPAKGAKNDRILGALEPLINSGVLWAHVSVLNGPLWAQMRDWNPAIKDQPDDFLDSGAGALLQAPVRIGRAGKPADVSGNDWRPYAGVSEVTLVT